MHAIVVLDFNNYVCGMLNPIIIVPTSAEYDYYEYAILFEN